MTVDASGSFLESGIASTVDNFNRNALDLTSKDGIRWIAQNGVWVPNGSKLVTSTGRGSDPRIILFRPYSDCDIQVDAGFGDALYFRWVDGNNWWRATLYQQTSLSPQYACGTFSCNCTSCNCVSCNCVDNFTQYRSVSASCHCSNPNQTVGCTVCNSAEQCCSPCPNGCFTGTYNCAFNGGTCSVYTGQTCQTCCSSCCQTCTSFCQDTYYDTYVRLDRVVGGTLTDMGTVHLGNGAVPGTLRVRAKGNSIKVYANAATERISITDANHRFGRGYGMGRVGYGNQDSGSTLDNLTLQLAA